MPGQERCSSRELKSADGPPEAANLSSGWDHKTSSATQIPSEAAYQFACPGSVARFARNLDDLRSLVRILTRKGMRVEFIKEILVFTGEDSP